MSPFPSYLSFSEINHVSFGTGNLMSLAWQLVVGGSAEGGGHAELHAFSITLGPLHGGGDLLNN